MRLKELLSIMAIDGSYDIKINGNHCGYIYDYEYIAKNKDIFYNARVESISIRKNKTVMFTIYQCDIKGAIK